MSVKLCLQDCWQERCEHHPTPTPTYFLVSGKSVVGDVDYDNTAPKPKNMLANVRILEEEPDEDGKSEEIPVHQRGDAEGEDNTLEMQATENVYNETAGTCNF